MNFWKIKCKHTEKKQYSCIFFLKNAFFYLDRPLILQRHTLAKDIKEETLDELSQSTSPTSTNVSLTPLHQQYHANKYVVQE